MMATSTRAAMQRNQSDLPKDRETMRLQRKCACGNHTVAGTPCTACAASKRKLERHASHVSGAGSVHTCALAGESTRALDAVAYTVGHDIVLGPGQYAPETATGGRLLAHELTHVVQQEAAGSPAVQTRLAVTQPGDRFEQEADRMADDVMGRHASTTKRQPGAPLPYREATELAKCIAIMGDASAEYCREVVLGDKPQPGCNLTTVKDPLDDISTFQSPGASGWWGAKFGCYRNACSRPHKGWDIHAAPSTPIIAATAGSVTHHQDPGGFGNYIRLTSQTDSTRVYLYGHLSAREPAGSYCAGETIGQTGTTGNASADRPHLHFQAHISGTPVDPAGYFTEPSQVIEASGSSATAIDKTLAESCAPCAM
jgi:murein DD-endopeptidase MepM/ murein hydrolase activator NlpD